MMMRINHLSGAKIKFRKGANYSCRNQLPVQNLDPGIYTLEIKVVDRISSRTLVTSTEFRVLNPPPGR